MPKDQIVAGSFVQLLTSRETGNVVQVRETSKTCVVKMTHDGSLRKNVLLNEVKVHRPVSPSKSQVHTNVALFDRGQAVMARYKKGTRWYKGRIDRIHSDTPTTYDIVYDDGDEEAHVAENDLQAVHSDERSNHNDRTYDRDQEPAEDRFQVGEKVRGRFHKGAKWYDGEVSRVRVDGTYDLTYEDGDQEEHVGHEYIQRRHEKRPQVALKQKPLMSHLRTGLKVDVRDHVNHTLLPGEIQYVHTVEEACDVLYDTGVSEKYVSFDRIDLQAKEIQSFCLGDRVKAYYAKGDTLYPAVILKVHEDEKIDLQYDAGDVETRVSSRYVVKSIEQPPTRLEAVKSEHDQPIETETKTLIPQRPVSPKDQAQATGTPEAPIREYVLLLEHLAMTLYERKEMKTRPQLICFDNKERGNSDSNASTSNHSTDDLETSITRLFDAPMLSSFRNHFASYTPIGDPPHVPKEKLFHAIQDRVNSDTTTRPEIDVIPILTEWFTQQESLRSKEEFPFSTMILSLAYVNNRIAKLSIEKLVISTLGGVRFASNKEQSLQQIHLWQQMLGDRLYQLLLQRFLAHSVPNCDPPRVYVKAATSILSSLQPENDVVLQVRDLGLCDFDLLHLSECFCLYVQQFGARKPWNERCDTFAIALKSIAFLAAFLYLERDECIYSHGELVRRLCVGRTPSQVILILQFRDVFESFLQASSPAVARKEAIVSTSNLQSLKTSVSHTTSGLLERDLIALQRRAHSVSLVELYASCGFSIDAIAAIPTVSNVVERLKLQMGDPNVVGGIINVVRSLCLKILGFPDHSAYWRVRVDTKAFHAKIGRFQGAECLLEAVGFVISTDKRFYELKDARTYSLDGVCGRVKALPAIVLEDLRIRCSELDTQLAMLDGVDSILSIFRRLQRARSTCQKLTDNECAQTLKFLLLYVENALECLEDPSRWRIRKNNSLFRRQIGRFEEPFADDLMAVIGFHLNDSERDPTYVLCGSNGKHRLDVHVEWFLWRRRQELQAVQSDDIVWLRETLQLATTHTNAEKPTDTIASSSFLQQQQLSMLSELFHRISDTKTISYETLERAIRTESKVSIPLNVSRVWLSPLAFDSNCDGTIDEIDFQKAFGVLLCEPFECITCDTLERNIVTGKRFVYTQKLSLPNAIAELVGKLRIRLKFEDAYLSLLLLNDIAVRILENPKKPHLWWQLEERKQIARCDTAGKYHFLLRFPAGRSLMALLGYEAFHQDSTITYWRFARIHRAIRSRVGSLLGKEVARVDIFASILQQHLRVMYFADHLSDVNAVARGIVSGVRSKRYRRMLEILLRCVDNILDDSEATTRAYRQIHTASRAFEKYIGSVRGAMALFQYVGFRTTREKTSILEVPDDVTHSMLRRRRLEVLVAYKLLELTEEEATESM